MHETPQFELPRPAPQRAPEVAPGQGQEKVPGRAFPERLAPRGNQTPVGQHPSAQALAQPVPLPHPVALPSAHGQTSQVKGPAKADDVDVIEKEWVTRAKQVLNHTKHDPYRKSSAINSLKTDYITKRFGGTKG